MECKKMNTNNGNKKIKQEIKIFDGKTFKEAINSLASIVDEATIELRADGLHINVIDKSHIEYISMWLDGASIGLDGYRQDVGISIDITKFNKICKRISNVDDVRLIFYNNYLDVVLFNYKTSNKRIYKLAGLDLEYNEPTEPTGLPVDTELLMDAQAFYEGLRECYEFDKVKVALHLNDNKLNICCVDAPLTISNNDIEILKDGSRWSYYGIKQLFNIAKTCRKLNKEVNIRYAEDSPIIVEYKLDDATSSSYYRVTLAPRLDIGE